MNTSPAQTQEKEKTLLYIDNTTSADVILNCPKKINALGEEMIEELLKITSGLTTQSSIDFGSFKPFEVTPYTYDHTPKVIFFQGAGDHFCSGGKGVSCYKGILANDKEGLIKGYQAIITLNQYIMFMRPIQISLWSGFVMGGGVGISINAPIRIANETTVFSMPECQLGLFPDVGASYFLTHILNPQIGLYAGLTGYRFKGEEIMNTGIATHFIKKENLQKAKEAIEALCKNKENVSVEDIKEELKKHGEEYQREKFKFKNEDLINEVFKPDSIYEIFKRLETMKESNDERKKKFADITLKILSAASPISILIFTEMCKRASELKDVKECYLRDYASSHLVMMNGDFKEGIRAILIEKDKKFNWKYKSIYDIKNPDEIIKEFLPWY